MQSWRSGRQTRFRVGLLCASIALACGTKISPIDLVPPTFGAGTMTLQIELAFNYAPGSLLVFLDGRLLAGVDEEASATGRGTRASIMVPAAAGPHLVVAMAAFEVVGRQRYWSDSRFIQAPRGAPELIGSVPGPDAGEVSPAAWPILEFADELSQEVVESFELVCGGRALDYEPTRPDPRRVVLNPRRTLPGGVSCVVAWRGPRRRAELAFRTGIEPRSSRATHILYDRDDRTISTPYPDDYWTLPDVTTATGRRVAFSPPERAEVRGLLEVLVQAVDELDGFSPISHLVLESSDAIDPASVPLTPAASLDPLASIVLFDVDPQSPSHGMRHPFRLELRSDPIDRDGASIAGSARAASGEGAGYAHTALIFPSIPLSPATQYGLIVTRRVRDRLGRGLAPATMQAHALASPRRRESPSVSRLRRLIAPLIEVAGRVEPAIRPDDIALALVFGVRSDQDIPSDLLAARAQIHSMPVPEHRIDGVERIDDAASPVAAIVHGTWWAPEFRDGALWRRDALGRPVLVDLLPLPFTLSLPRAALAGPAPVVMYQHGNPGSAEREVPSSARDALVEAGFAVIGFTDILNRELSPGIGSSRRAIQTQLVGILTGLLEWGRVPDFAVQTNAEQIAFLRMISGLGELDLLPVGAPDGVPDLDVASRLGYVGVSQGANYAPALLPYAPEIGAAALVSGGGRLSELLLHQSPESFLLGYRPADAWLALALFQAGFDRQDAHNHASFLYVDPLELAGPDSSLRLADRASVLLIAGIDDTLVPNHATDSLAWQLGPIPQLEPIARRVPFLPRISGPVSGNIDPRTTAAYQQFAPQGIPGVAPSPGCVPPAVSDRAAREGHFCAQSARESRQQRANFLLSALRGGAPEIPSVQAASRSAGVSNGSPP